MKVQIITSNLEMPLEMPFNSIYTISPFSEPKTFDAFDVNVLDLNCSKLWHCKKSTPTGIDCISDLKSLSTILSTSKKSNNIIVFPQNQDLKYSYLWRSTGTGEYTETIKLKDVLQNLQSTVFSYIFLNHVELSFQYENSVTEIANHKLRSAFVFSNEDIVDYEFEVVTRADGSEKATTVCLNNRFYYTTINILENIDCLTEYLKAINVWKSERSDCPEWIKDVEFYNDSLQNKIIEDKKTIIREAEIEIEKAEEQLDKNLWYKTILYTNGDELVEVVFSILGQLFDYDLSDFVDEKKEDFQIHLDKGTLIGEIKGVTSNVKFEHISQLEVHFQRYQDLLLEEKRTESVKQVLIINPLRSKPVSKRESIHQDVINLAKRNEALIIETYSLLKLLEMFLQEEVTKEDIIKAIFNNSGLFNENMLGTADK